MKYCLMKVKEKCMITMATPTLILPTIMNRSSIKDLMRILLEEAALMVFGTFFHSLECPRRSEQWMLRLIFVDCRLLSIYLSKKLLWEWRKQLHIPSLLTVILAMELAMRKLQPAINALVAKAKDMKGYHAMVFT